MKLTQIFCRAKQAKKKYTRIFKTTHKGFYRAGSLVYCLFMHSYPVFLNLKNAHCVIVGAGQVGQRKAQTLLNAGVASLLMLDTAQADVSLQALIHKNPKLSFAQRDFLESDLENCFLAISATSDAAVNALVAQACHKHKVLCNVADNPTLSDFIVPSTVRRGDLTLAVCTNGKSPALSKYIRTQLEKQFGNEYAQYLSLLGTIRSLLLKLGLPVQENTNIFRKLIHSSLLIALQNENIDAATYELQNILPQELHDAIGGLLDEIF